MLKTTRLLNGLLTGGVAATLLLASCGDKKSSNNIAASPAKTTEAPATPPTGKIAYVNIDTLQAKYEYLKARKAEFEKETNAMNAEIDRLTQSFQNEYTAFQKKAQAGGFTQTEGEAAQKKLGQMQQNIENRRQTLGNELMKKQDAFNKELKQRLDNYLVKYNADKGYDYILSHGEGGSILFANKALDITEDVVKGMNAESGAAGESKTEEKK